MPIIEGKKYTYNELAEMSGRPKATLQKRFRDHPGITLAELIAPPKPRRATLIVVVDGKQYSLYQWAKMNHCPGERVYGRWHLGERDPQKLIGPSRGRGPQEKSPDEIPGAPKKQKPCKSGRHLSEEQKAWLRETTYARAGMTQCWKIACDLLGLPRSDADWVRREMEGNDAGSD